MTEDHDEDGRAEDDGGRIAHGQASEPDEDARDREATHDALHVHQQTDSLRAERIGPHDHQHGHGQGQLDDGAKEEHFRRVDPVQQLHRHGT